MRSLSHSLSLSRRRIYYVSLIIRLSRGGQVKKKNQIKTVFSARGASSLLITAERACACARLAATASSYGRINLSPARPRRTVFISVIRLIASIFYVIFSFVIFRGRNEKVDVSLQSACVVGGIIIPLVMCGERVRGFFLVGNK